MVKRRTKPLSPGVEVVAGSPPSTTLDHTKLGMTGAREVLRLDPEVVAEHSGEEEAERVRQKQDRALRAAAKAAAARPRQQAAGQKRKGQSKVQPAELRTAFLALRGRVRHRTEACRRVAKQFGVGRETVRKATEKLPF